MKAVMHRINGTLHEVFVVSLPGGVGSNPKGHLILKILAAAI